MTSFGIRISKLPPTVIHCQTSSEFVHKLIVPYSTLLSSPQHSVNRPFTCKPTWYKNKQMAAVYVKSISSGKWLQIHQNEISDRLLTYDFIKERLFDWECVSSSDINVKVFHGSQEVRPGCPLNLSSQDVFLNTSISLVGGKGGN